MREQSLLSRLSFVYESNEWGTEELSNLGVLVGHPGDLNHDEKHSDHVL